MKRSAVVLIIVVLLGLSLVWLGGCRDDVTVPFPESLTGNYVGIYSLLRVNGIDTIIPDTTNSIILRFTQSTYNIKVDETIDGGDRRFFCDAEGGYSLTNGIQFTEEDGNLTNKVCTPGDNPTGSFGLDQSTLKDTILMTQVSTDSLNVQTTKTIKITRK